MSVEPSSRPPELVKYRLLDEIGHGGMATVYRALDVRLDREVAIKLMHPHLRDNHEAAARFVAEARAVAQLRHQGIVEIYDVSDEEDDERFLVAQLVRGPSLRKLLKDHPEIPPEIGACFGVLLCDALAHAHEKGIIHRDVKPENVLVELNESRKTAAVKLTDFGIAKVIDAQGVTSTGQVLGSPAHMAPEQIDGGNVDVRTDIFSVGVLVYECMVGHLPFEGKNPAQVLRKVLDGNYPDPDKERATVGARWASILAKAIAKDPEDRWGDARAFGAAMREELEAFGIRDARAEVYAYLSDPPAYVEAFAPRLVEALVARATRARESGDTQSAAGDLNRAVAYAPDDQELLQQLTSLATGVRRREMMVRAKQAAVVVVAFVALGTGAFMFARWVRVEPVALTPSVESLTSPTSVDPPTIPIPRPTLTVSAKPPTVETSEPPVTVVKVTGPAPQKDREVLIKAPGQGGAVVSIDGGGPVPVGFGQTVVLPTGPHSFTFSIPPDKANNCCNPRTVQVEVAPGEGPQLVIGGATFRDARITAVGPPGSWLDCSAVGRPKISPGETVSVPMGKMEDTVSCFARGSEGSGIPPKEIPIRLKAGQLEVGLIPQPR